MERPLFNRQPARALLLDLQGPIDAVTCSNIHKALSDVLSLAVHLLGPPTARIPLFSLFVLRSYTECLFPLQPIRGNLPRIQVALSELKSISNEFLLSQRRHTRNSLVDGIQEALTQFKSLYIATTIRGEHTATSSSPSQIELVILTGQDSQVIQKSIERVIQHLDLENLKKIQIITVSDPDKLMEEPQQQERDDVKSIEEISIVDSSQSSSNEFSLGVFDIFHSNNDTTSLQSLFKGWLHDCSSDSEHLQIVLPSQDDKKKIILKCDLMERILDPSNLPSTFSKNFIIQTGSFTGIPQTQSGSGRSNSVHPPTSVPVYRLRSVGTVTCDGICESVVYGSPYIVKSTCCWKLDWDELETNQHHFQALCFHLKDRNQALLLTSDASVSSSSSSLPQVVASYLLLPSTSPSSLLLKAVVCNELLLPVDLGEGECQQLYPESVDTIGDSLSNLDHQDVYNPYTTHSQLFSVIQVATTNTAVTAARKGGTTAAGSTYRGRGGRGGRGSGGSGQVKRKLSEPSFPQVTSSGTSSSTVIGNSVASKRGGRGGGSTYSLKKPRTGFIYGGKINYN